MFIKFLIGYWVVAFFLLAPVIFRWQWVSSMLSGEYKTKKRQVVLGLFVVSWMAFLISVGIYLTRLLVAIRDGLTPERLLLAMMLICMMLICLILNFILFGRFVDKVRQLAWRRNLQDRLEGFLGKINSMDRGMDMFRDFLELPSMIDVLDLTMVGGYILKYGPASDDIPFEIRRLMTGLGIYPDDDYPNMRETLKQWIFFDEDSHEAKLNSTMVLAVG